MAVAPYFEALDRLLIGYSTSGCFDPMEYIEEKAILGRGFRRSHPGIVALPGAFYGAQEVTNA